MKIPSLVRLPKNKSFQFEPRFYNEAKERIDELKKNVEAEVENTPQEKEYVSKIKFKREKMEKKTLVTAAALRILMMVIIALGGVAYLHFDGYENYVLGVLAFTFVAYIFARRHLER